MAKLNFKYATMNSGKTMDLIRTAYNYEENNYKILVIKPAVDTKSDNFISSRTGLKRQVDYLVYKNDSIIELLKDDLENVACILVDESQFLTREQVDELFLITKKLDIPVICYGLRTNFQMNSFEGSRRLLEIAEELEELKTMCSCGNIARYVGRKVNDIFVTTGEEVVIDGANSNTKYIPLCGSCYLTKVKKINLKENKIREE